MKKMLMKGNEALAMAAIEAGCSHFFGYPITPQNEIPEYLARELPARGGVFLQAESELAAINMVYGAAAAGARVLTTSSSPGIALMQETISILAAAELACVIVNVQRGGPGIGTIQPSQGDYRQMTKGGGNGDYHVLSLAPSTVEEGATLMFDAFALAERYRMPVFIVSDGMLGQMMEPVALPERSPVRNGPRDDQVTGHGNARGARVVKTLALDPAVLEKKVRALHAKFLQLRATESRYASERLDDAELVLCAYGSVARICRNTIELLRAGGIRAGLLRPITLWPFPDRPFQELPPCCRGLFVVEMSMGQMVDDVRLAVAGALPVGFYGRSGGNIPTPEEIGREAEAFLRRLDKE